MPRTTSSDVLANYHADSADVDTAAVDDAIADANAIVTARLAGEFGSDLLERIEKLVARHYLTQSTPALSKFSSETSGGSFEGETGEGWNATRYGQRALELSGGAIAATDESDYVVTTQDV